ncbi:MAG TPA: glycosyltransferase [Jatrophihabitans sp.]|jgi:glycosyltransferase involved in cell wall biosynthesis
MHGLTIVARGDVASAAVLARTFAAAHPDARFTIVVTDAEPGEYISGSDTFEILAAVELPISNDEFRKWALVYDEVELRQVLKPWAVEMLFEAGNEVVVLLDPNIAVYASLDEVESLARKNSVVLVPHTTEPPARDGLRPTEGELLAAGIYDLGFMAFGPDSNAMLTWWKEGLRRDTHVAPHPALTFTQRWIDLVPAYFEHAILRDPGYNVGYKNLDTRVITDSNDRLLVNGSELRFCHFTGYDPSVPWLLSGEASDNPRVVLSEHPLVRDLCDQYGRDLVAAAEEFPQVEYRFADLDGLAIRPVLRELYRHALADSDRRDIDGPPLPFSGSDREISAWFREPVRPQAHLNRFLYGVWEIRYDLRNAFPHPLGADESEFINWAWLNRDSDSHLVAELLPDEVAPERPPILATDTPGVNLAGYFLAELGVGEMARLLVDGIKSIDIPYNTLTTRQTASRQNAQFEETGSVVRYPVTIAAVNADVFITWTREVGPELLEGRYLAAMWAWEVEQYPDYSAAMSMVDEIWTLSRFGRAAIAKTTDKPVHVIPLPIREPAPHSPLDRAAIGIPDGPYMLFAFDYFSTVERKNPFAVINAFSQAFDEGTGPSLVIKSINGDRRRADRERLRRACSQRRDIFLLEDYLDASVVSSLMGEATAYVSLHRAEGFGLTMAEAMARGVPVVATGYSGNLEFMTSDNSMLVPFTRVPVPSGCDPYPTSSPWAEADVDVAAAYLRWVYDNPTAAAELGRIGRSSILRTCSMDNTTRFLRERIENMLQISEQTRREKAVWKPAQQAQDPTASSSAIDRARAMIHRAPDVTGPSRVPVLASYFRRLVYRTLAHHDEQSKDQLDALIDALAHLEEGQLALQASVSGLAADLNSQAERVEEISVGSHSARRELVEYQRLSGAIQNTVAEIEQRVNKLNSDTATTA